MRLPLLFTLGCACIPTLGFAQSTPHLYLGAGASLLNVRPFQSYSFNAIGPAFTVGVQLSPRWAIQTGATLGWHTRNNSINRDSAASTLGAYAFNDRLSLLVVPLLVRWTLTDPAARLHIDLMAGASWQHTGTNRTTRYTDATNPSRNLEGGYKLASNTANVVVGPALRYDVGTHVALTANALLSAQTLGIKYYNGTFADRLFLTGQVGVQYTFGH